MKKLLFTLGFIGIIQFAFSQDKTETVNDQTIKITLAENDALKAKELKGLQAGKLFKGESRTVFLIAVSEENIDDLKVELKALFPTCKVELIKE